jgi:cell division protein FtsB
MKINLRKASVVQQTILDEIKRLGTEETTIKVSLFEPNVFALLEEQMTKVKANHAQAGRLLNANKFLRAVVAKKNAEVGIADYLAEEAMLASAESRLKGFSESTVRPNLDALAAEIESRKANSNNERMSIYGRDYSVDVAVVPAEAIETAKKELESIRKRRRKIKDEMVSLNVRTEIEVPEQVALVLTELGLD